MGLTIRDGDATQPDGGDPRVIVHICNDVGGWGRGFVMELSRRWPDPERQYRRWYRDRDNNDFALGAVQFVDVGDGIVVANLVGQRGLRSSNSGPPIRYEAVGAGLARVADYAARTGASVHMPRIGCGLAGGRWEEIEPLVLECLVEHGISVTVYDLPS